MPNAATTFEEFLEGWRRFDRRPEADALARETWDNPCLAAAHNYLLSRPVPPVIVVNADGTLPDHLDPRKKKRKGR